MLFLILYISFQLLKQFVASGLDPSIFNRLIWDFNFLIQIEIEVKRAQLYEIIKIFNSLNCPHHFGHMVISFIIRISILLISIFKNIENRWIINFLKFKSSYTSLLVFLLFLDLSYSGISIFIPIDFSAFYFIHFLVIIRVID